MLQFRGGLTIADNPTIFTDPEQARCAAEGRLAKRDRDADDDDFDAEAYDAHKMAKCGGPAECRWCDSLPDTREEW
jgi:hypothetical protein